MRPRIVAILLRRSSGGKGAPVVSSPAMATAPRKERSLLPIVVGAVLIAAGVAGFRAWELSRGSADADALAFRIDAADAPAPPVDLETVAGRFSLAASKGQVVFLNFWATWCPPCRDEMPSMVALGRELALKYPGRFKMVAVSVDDDWKVVADFFRGPPPPTLIVARDADQSVTKGYYCAARGRCPDSYKFPESYLVDGTGRLVGYVVGPRNWSAPTVRRYLESLIERTTSK
jgi:thiol-disulfide isomerase/thioredoxin